LLMLPCWRTMQRMRFRALRRALPGENALDGSGGALEARVCLLFARVRVQGMM
jgi:hypothetical protein